MAAGVALVVAGGLLWLAVRMGLPLGRLPGDLRVEGERSAFYFPVVTCLLASVALTVLINVALVVARRFFE
jgi:hypothetical protein